MPMALGAISALLKKKAPRTLGAIFCLQTLLTLTSCDGNGKSPDWDTPGQELPEKASQATPRPASTPTPPAVVTAVKKDAQIAPIHEPVAQSGLRLISYNFENWLTMDRYVGGRNLKGAPKPDAQKQAVIEILTRHSPDVIGLCEIGEESDLKDIQESLKTAGLDLPHSYYTGGADPVRHLGMLSRFPILSTARPAVVDYSLNGQTFAINRGVLDASIEAHGKIYRFLGLHLKSKRDSDQGDQEAIRLNEARLVRLHIDSILASDPEARIVVYGDLNDTRGSPAIKELTGKTKAPNYLTAIPAKDAQGNSWTHHWDLHDIYSRIDFIMVSKGLRDEVDFAASKIIDDSDWENASDHRPVLGLFK
jgi:endonuclease/exonuclease/phosphatase family metal-dependent hydrolase